MSAESLSRPVLQVKARAHTYPVFLGRDCLGEIGPRLSAVAGVRPGSACAVVTDSNVGPRYAAPVLESLHSAGFRASLVTVAAGETSKSWQVAGQVAEELVTRGLDRHSVIVALGGGVVGDLAGFVASVYHRGILCAQVPTTIVAQVDSAIGGKTGVNTPSGKNLLGAFHAPCLVLADVAVLRTLPERVFEEGFAEIIKHGAIADHALCERLLLFERGDEGELRAIIRRSLELKAGIVAQDEEERLGLRALLNFGHTVGHGIEQAGGYGRYLHGEAVALGMLAAARLSSRKAGLPAADVEQIIRCLRHFRLPTALAADVATDAILASLRRDKKFDSGSVRFVLTPGLGRARLSSPGEITEDDLRAEIEALRQPAP